MFSMSVFTQQSTSAVAVPAGAAVLAALLPRMGRED